MVCEPESRILGERRGHGCGGGARARFCIR